MPKQGAIIIRSRLSCYLGFTLLELLVVISILVILITLAIPVFDNVIQNNRTTSLSNELISTLYLARSEAIKRGVSVSVCAARDAQLNSCGTNWNNGWIVFTNPNEDGQFDNNDSEIALRVTQSLGTGYSVSSSPSNIATYTSSGFPSAATSNMVFTLRPTSCTGNNVKTVTISPTARIVTSLVAC